jgi:hypothetical protein
MNAYKQTILTTTTIDKIDNQALILLLETSTNLNDSMYLQVVDSIKRGS